MQKNRARFKIDLASRQRAACRHLLLIARAPPNGRSAMILLQQPTATWRDDFNSRSLLKGLDILLAGSCSVRSCRCAPLPTVLADEVANPLGELKVASICCLRGRSGNQNVRRELIRGNRRGAHAMVDTLMEFKRCCPRQTAATNPEPLCKSALRSSSRGHRCKPIELDKFCDICRQAHDTLL